VRKELGIVAHACNSNTGEVEAEEDHELKTSLGYSVRPCLKKERARHWWLTPVTLATQETEVRRIAVQGQPRANSL
jgi:hypothetical protein